MTRKDRQRDPRSVPTYGLLEAGHYLSIPVATLRSWVLGRSYPVSDGKKFFKPVISAAATDPCRLSFINLVEAQVLDAVRRQEKIDLPKVRRTIEYLRERFQSEHPLAEQQFETDGVDLFVQKYGELINTSQGGQLAMRKMLKGVLKRIRRDRQGAPTRLYLFTRPHSTNDPMAVVVDPEISFGRPVLKGTGIVTSILAERYKGGETIEDLAQDYARPRTEIEEALRYELRAA